MEQSRVDGRKQQHKHLTIGTFLMNLLATDTNAMGPSTSTNLPWFLSGHTNWDNPVDIVQAIIFMSTAFLIVTSPLILPDYSIPPPDNDEEPWHPGLGSLA